MLFRTRIYIKKLRSANFILFVYFCRVIKIFESKIMKRATGLSIIVLCSLQALAISPSRILIDDGWKFTNTDSAIYKNPGVNTSDWKPISLPHDWSVGHDFDKDEPSGNDVGYLPTGKGWYRKTIDISPDNVGKPCYLYFEGAYLYLITGRLFMPTRPRCIWPCASHKATKGTLRRAYGLSIPRKKAGIGPDMRESRLRWRYIPTILRWPKGYFHAQRAACDGRALAVVKSNGREGILKVKAKAKGLKAGEIVIRSKRDS